MQGPKYPNWWPYQSIEMLASSIAQSFITASSCAGRMLAKVLYENEVQACCVDLQWAAESCLLQVFAQHLLISHCVQDPQEGGKEWKK